MLVVEVDVEMSLAVEAEVVVVTPDVTEEVDDVLATVGVTGLESRMEAMSAKVLAAAGVTDDDVVVPELLAPAIDATLVVDDVDEDDELLVAEVVEFAD